MALVTLSASGMPSSNLAMALQRCTISEACRGAAVQTVMLQADLGVKQSEDAALAVGMITIKQSTVASLPDADSTRIRAGSQSQHLCDLQSSRNVCQEKLCPTL